MSSRQAHEVPTNDQLRLYLLGLLFDDIEGFTLYELQRHAEERYPRMRGKLPVVQVLSTLIAEGAVILVPIPSSWNDVYRLSPQQWIVMAA